jgi:hypothetical protein
MDDSRLDHGHDWPELIAAVAHDVRGAAGLVAHQAELLAGAGIDEVERRRSAVAIELSAADLDRLADALTTLAWAATSDRDLRLEPVDIFATVTAAVGRCDRRSGGARGEAGILVDTDPTVLRRVLAPLARRAARTGTAGTTGTTGPAVTATVLAGPAWVDVVITGADGSTAAEQELRPVTPQDGLDLYVAARLALLTGAELLVGAYRQPATRYHLRLPLSSRGEFSFRRR